MGLFRPSLVTEWLLSSPTPSNPEGIPASSMKIFKDVFSGDELFSDTYPMKLVDDCMYEVYGKHETRVEGEIALAGSNASAEEADEGCDTNAVSGVDLVLNHRLKENDRASEVDTFKKNINGVMKELLGKFKDLQFYTGESMDADAMIMIMDYKEIDGEERPVLLAFKHGLEEEKC